MVESNYTVPERDIRKDLGQLNAELQIVQSGILVVISSLREQRADLDPDVISVLEHHISSRLCQQMDGLEELIGSLQPRARVLTDA